jgi:hypothetical protein
MKTVLFFCLISNACLTHTHSVMLWSKAKYRSRLMFFVAVLLVVLQTTGTDAARVRSNLSHGTRLFFSNLLFSQSKLCPVVTLPEHGFFFSGFCNRTPGTLCGLGCLTGYRLVEGDSFHECLANGTWTGRQPKCQGKSYWRYSCTLIVELYLEMYCSPLKVHSRVVHSCVPKIPNTNKIKIGTKCQTKCNVTGYRLVGPRTRECLSVGKWSGYDQSCIGKYQ